MTKKMGFFLLFVLFCLVPFHVSAFIIDNNDEVWVERVGVWQSSTAVNEYYGSDYLHDQNVGDGSKSFSFLPGEVSDFVAGEYLIDLWWTDHTNRASDVPVSIFDGLGTTYTLTVNQEINGGQWNFLGRFMLWDGSRVTLGTEANGFVIADAAQFTPVPEPGTFALLGVGIAGAWLVSRRKSS